MTPNTHKARHKSTHDTKQRHHSQQSIRTLSSLTILSIRTPWPDDIPDLVDLPDSTNKPDCSEDEDDCFDDVERVHGGVEVTTGSVGGEEAGCWVVVVVIIFVVDYFGPMSATYCSPVAGLLSAVGGVDGAGAACYVELAVGWIG